MKTTFKFLACLSFFCFSCLTMAQEKPAAPGYFKNKPSNTNQDRQLKELEKQEAEDNRPAPKPTPPPTEKAAVPKAANPKE